MRVRVDSDDRDLAERLKIIESMMAEARRETKSWGWAFVVWGLAFYVAMAWAHWGSANIAWPVTVTVTAFVTGIVASKPSDTQPRTSIGRAIGSVWISVGISMLVLLLALGTHGLLETQIFMAFMAAMLGTANAASGMILKWKAQLGCTVIWWATSWTCVVGTEKQATQVLMAAIFLCQIVFGFYAIAVDYRRRDRSKVIHA
jgi:hypothetical protein